MHKLSRYFAIFLALFMVAFCFANEGAAASKEKSKKKSVQVVKTSKKSAYKKYSRVDRRVSRADVRPSRFDLRSSRLDNKRLTRAELRALSRKHPRRTSVDVYAAADREIYYAGNIKSAPVLLVKPTDGELSSGFGIRRLGIRSSVRMHKGVDFSAPRGTPVVASADGIVTSVGHNGAYGRIIEIDHGGGVSTRYAHLDSINTEEGAKVRAGKKIGTVGRTGRTTGANLHFEVLVDNMQINPMRAAAWTSFAGNERRAKHRIY